MFLSPYCRNIIWLIILRIPFWCWKKEIQVLVLVIPHKRRRYEKNIEVSRVSSCDYSVKSSIWWRFISLLSACTLKTTGTIKKCLDIFTWSPCRICVNDKWKNTNYSGFFVIGRYRLHVLSTCPIGSHIHTLHFHYPFFRLFAYILVDVNLPFFGIWCYVANCYFWRPPLMHNDLLLAYVSSPRLHLLGIKSKFWLFVSVVKGYAQK